MMRRSSPLERFRASAVAVVLACAWVGCGTEEVADAGAPTEAKASALAEERGDPAPDFTLPDLQGRSVTLSEHRGKTVVVDFWATWCPPCIFQVPELNKFWNANKDRGDLMVIGVAVDVEGAEVVAPWAEEQGVEYTIVIGDESLAKKFGAMGFPTLAIVRPDGTLDSLHVGLIEVDELESLTATLRNTDAT